LSTNPSSESFSGPDLGELRTSYELELALSETKSSSESLSASEQKRAPEIAPPGREGDMVVTEAEPRRGRTTSSPSPPVETAKRAVRHILTFDVLFRHAQSFAMGLTSPLVVTVLIHTID
jgi:hypothetical protein